VGAVVGRVIGSCLGLPGLPGFPGCPPDPGALISIKQDPPIFPFFAQRIPESALTWFMGKQIVISAQAVRMVRIMSHE